MNARDEAHELGYALDRQAEEVDRWYSVAKKLAHALDWIATDIAFSAPETHFWKSNRWFDRAQDARALWKREIGER